MSACTSDSHGLFDSRVVSNFMVVPGCYPSISLVASDQIQVSSIGCQPLSIVIEGEYLFVRKRNTAYAVSPAVVAILVFVNIISQEDHVVNRILFFISWFVVITSGRIRYLSYTVSICVEETERIICTRIYRDAHCSYIIIGMRRRFGTSDWALVAGAANIELVVIGSV